MGRVHTYSVPPPGLGARVKELRDKKGWNQSGLARIASTSQNYLSRIETGSAHPPAFVALRLAEALQVSVYYLLTGQTKDPYQDRL